MLRNRFGDWLRGQDEDGSPHLVPDQDIRDHYYECCPCMPETVDGLCIHNAFDGREDFETGRRLPS